MPRRVECVLDRSGIAACKIGDDHHVFDVPGGDAEGFGRASEESVAVCEVGAYHDVRVVDLPRDQPAVIPPLRQPLRRRDAHTFQALCQERYVTYVHGWISPWWCLLIWGDGWRRLKTTGVVHGGSLEEVNYWR
jgi:hypothetical protein